MKYIHALLRTFKQTDMALRIVLSAALRNAITKSVRSSRSTLSFTVTCAFKFAVECKFPSLNGFRV
jgi:hypothetical protein